MFRPTPPIARLIPVSLTAYMLLGCSTAPEQPILNQFFTASRLRDNTSLGGFSTVSFDPGTQGTVTSFKIANVTAEQRKPLGLKALAKAQDDARAEDDAFINKRADYASQAGDALERVVRAGRDARLKGKDAEVQEGWFKLVDEGIAIGRKVTDAKRALAAQTAIANLSVANPGNPVILRKFDGDLVSKDVTVDANVRQPDGQTVKKSLVITMQRAELKGERDVTGRWIITGIKDGSGAAATPRS